MIDEDKLDELCNKVEGIAEHVEDLAARINFLWKNKNEVEDALEKVENATGYFNNRMLELEGMFNAIDPKYLAMGEALSQSNLNMIENQLQRDRLHFNNFLKLGEEISKLNKRLDGIKKDD